MDLEKDLESLEQRINNNLDKNHNKTEKIHRNTGALEILQTFKADSNKFFIMWIVTFIALLGMIGYVIYLTNDISRVTTQEVEQDTTDGNNTYIGRDKNG